MACMRILYSKYLTLWWSENYEKLKMFLLLYLQQYPWMLVVKTLNNSTKNLFLQCTKHIYSTHNFKPLSYTTLCCKDECVHNTVAKTCHKWEMSYVSHYMHLSDTLVVSWVCKPNLVGVKSLWYTVCTTSSMKLSQGANFYLTHTFFLFSLWTELKVTNCTCASGWSCLMNLVLIRLFSVELLTLFQQERFLYTVN